MATKNDKLKVKIANAKRKITNFAQFIDGYVAERDFPPLEKRMKDIELEFETFNVNYTELEALVEDSAHAESRTEYEEKFYSAFGKATSFLNKHKSEQLANSSAAQSTEREIRSNSARNTTKTLPRVNLQTFSGSYETWLGFHDLFKSLVHDDDEIPDIKKLYHLKGSLKDEAAEIIASIELSAENYKVAWELLKERYDNRKIIRQTHVKALLNLQHISKDFPVRSLLDQVQKHFRALEALKEPVQYWDTLLIEIIENKLNPFIREKWEEASSASEKPTFKEMLTFLQRRAQFEDTKSVQITGKVQNSVDKKCSHSRFKQRSQQTFAASTAKTSCPHCQGEHAIYNCQTFNELPPRERFEAAKTAALCINCLRSHHRVLDCNGSPCRKCNKKHHTILHFEKQPPKETTVVEGSAQSQPTANFHAQTSSEGLLGTAIVDLVNADGRSQTCRVFLDFGSQANFITEATATFLKLPKKLVDISISCVDNISTEIKYSVLATLKSRFDKYSKNIDFLVLNQISKSMPPISINRSSFEIPKNITLADPEFYKPSEIDVLIGIKLFFKLLCVGQISLKNHPEAVLQKTHLGWIVAGAINSSALQNNLQCHFLTQSTLSDANLTKFWEMEEVPSTKLLSPEEQTCENHFRNNTQRNSEGRYVVRLPFNENKGKLGNSRSMALRRFHMLEKRFDKNPQLKENYCTFMQEYEKLNHLSLIKIQKPSSGFYLPHHAVMKEDSLTTKIRVVFDGSAKTSSGVSLNDSLMVGPTIQDDLFALLTRFRSHRYALTADIEKMYRQVLVHPDDASYQKNLFRETPNETLKEFSLDTITYGTTCASFLAIRSLHQLADDEGSKYPIAAAVLKQDFYVDDLLTGANTRREAMLLRDDLNALLEKGCFPLRKWASNDPSFVPESSEGPVNTHMSLDPNSTVKTLGIQWNARRDSIFYKVDMSSFLNIVTKRSILSQVAKLFDPLGLLGPIIVKAKITIQLLWKAGLHWDSSIPVDIHTMWLSFKEQLPLLGELNFNRLIIAPDATEVQMHGFSDASEKAYGACIYLRSTDTQGEHHISLVCAKSRVAPVNPVTLPRLELSAALLLARLCTAVKQVLKIQFKATSLWSDSTIALHWIKTEPYLLKTFVANRVSEIQSLVPSCEWRHVPTQDNPADLVSRGLTPREFLNASIWINGPQWLSLEESNWPREIIQPADIPERRTIAAHPVCTETNLIDQNFIERRSSYNSLKSALAYVLRFLHNIRNPANKRRGLITIVELEAASRVLIRSTQLVAFPKEIQALKNGDDLDRKSRLIPLKPFLDKFGILRVGGRLTHANLTEEQKHQILLPPNRHITQLIILEEHKRLKHAGTQATLYSVRGHGRNITRLIIHKCVRCFRVKPREVDYVMGDLPQERVSHSRPFLNAGVDYCGPLHIKERRFRNRSKLKVYVAIFICLSTKAVHLELVSDLTTEAFIASLKRLFTRRGISKNIYSDNATNFVGASRELSELHKLFLSKQHNETVREFLKKEKINWNFIPPRSPHFGGLWEAAVKSFKHHFFRTVGDTLLTFEQLETFVIEIEAILNSRPLSPLSPDPNDLQPLTPGHFLIGGPLTSFPQVDLTALPINRLSAWQHAQQLRQHFWKRWHKEYLHQLTIRSRWQSNSSPGIENGTMVVIKEDNLPPLQWKLGRVVATQPGPDGIIRVAIVRTDTGEYKRCVKKLCPLSIEPLSHVNKEEKKPST